MSTRNNTISPSVLIYTPDTVLLGALAYESVDAGNAVLDRLHGRRVGKADMLAVARNAAAEMDVRQHGDTGLVEEPLAEFLRVGAARALARLGNVRPRIKCASRSLARETGHPAQQVDDQVASLEKRMPHRFRGVLGPCDRLHRGPLADLRSARFGVGDPAREYRRQSTVGNK